MKRKGGKKRGMSTVWDDGRTSIEKRSKRVLLRKEFGHFEGDFIESGKDGTGCILVLVERKTRYPYLQYLEDRSTQSVNRIVHEMLKGVPVKSLTLDNDISFQKHEKLSVMIGADIFFCHPQASHEKGSVENRNKAIRRYMPKKSDLSQYTDEYIRWVEEKLRNKFMLVLKGNTPQECFDEETEKYYAKVLKKTASRRHITNKGVLLQGSL